MRKLFIFLLLAPMLLMAQALKTPLEKKNFSEPTNYTELSAFVEHLKSPYLQVETIGKTFESRNIYALKFSKTTFGKDKSKLRILIFAQQHGNEQSGKEGALLLASELLKPENTYLFDKIDFALIPQVNADGSEQNKRRNSHNADLNRNHLILEEPEVIALHRFFDKYLFEVTMDVHEYAPFFSETWKKYGYRCNSDELIGVNTNCNISIEIRNYSNNLFVPFYRDYLTKHNFSNSIYAPGGPPEQDYIRHSTFDINDGRQSFGIQNTFSLIQEGLNGEDVFKDRIERRAKGQMTGMKAVLEFAYQQSATIKTMVTTNRRQLINLKQGTTFAIQMEHVRTGKQHPLPVYSYYTGKDSVIMVNDYRPLVKSISDITRPVGYLIPKNRTELINWSKRHELITSGIPSFKKFGIEQYYVTSIDSIDFETDMIINPTVKISVIDGVNADDYIFIPVNQLKGNLIIAALEPKSELGLVTYSSYRHLINAGEKYPVLRVVKKK
jgi:hypothetical protein